MAFVWGKIFWPSYNGTVLKGKATCRLNWMIPKEYHEDSHWTEGGPPFWLWLLVRLFLETSFGVSNYCDDMSSFLVKIILVFPVPAPPRCMLSWVQRKPSLPPGGRATSNRSGHSYDKGDGGVGGVGGRPREAVELAGQEGVGHHHAAQRGVADSFITRSRKQWEKEEAGIMSYLT